MNKRKSVVASDRAIALQNAEFDAVGELLERYRILTLVAVVDDDYPRVRHEYESALRATLQACYDNGRKMPIGLRLCNPLNCPCECNFAAHSDTPAQFQFKVRGHRGAEWFTPCWCHQQVYLGDPKHFVERRIKPERKKPANEQRS